MKKVAIITNILPVYRKGFYERLLDDKDIEIKIFCQNKIPGVKIQTIHNSFPENVELVKYLSLKREFLVWQFIPWRKLIKEYDLIFVSGNPRVLSDVLFGIYCLLIKKPIVLWTMGRSYKGSKITEIIRFFWSRFFNYIFVYTENDIYYLRKRNFISNKIIAMNNGLDQKEINEIKNKINNDEIERHKIENNLKDKFVIISSCRLEKKNNLDLMIKALKILKDKQYKIKWLIVGDGTQERNLRLLAESYDVLDNVSFLGSIYEESQIAKHFLASNILIHPGAIGLTLFHSYGYGLPVVLPNNANLHGPEYYAFEDHKTGLNFIRNDHLDLANKIIYLIDNNHIIEQMKNNCLSLVNENYNVDVMKSRFMGMVNFVLQS
jgi:glycosyltransferase involved in cell wall biosynthesis